MPTTIHDASWAQIEALRTQLEPSLAGAPDVATAAQRFAAGLAAELTSIVLARVFLVTTLGELPPVERRWAEAFAQAAGRPLPLDPATPVLALLGTAGVKPAWNDREQSTGHRAIPLLDVALIEGAPMIAALLASLEVDVRQPDSGTALQLRRLAGASGGGRFYVPDARVAVDGRGRRIIAATDFVAQHDVRTVFGMAGAYGSGHLVVAIVFTGEVLTVHQVDRFPSLIGTFKLATSAQATLGAWFPRA